MVNNIEMEEVKKPLSMNPKKFILWLLIVSIMMFFVALTSAYIVKQSDGNWLEYDMPMIFWYSTIIILLSSATMHWAYLAAKKDNLPQLKLALSITTVLGLSFLYSQWAGWGQLVDMGVYLVGNQTSGSFFYIITGAHGLHIISGVLFLIIVLISTYQYKVHSKEMNQLEICMTFWHFLGVLWVYLFLFLLLNQ
ncbi:cytochrome c oxidase subunit 3 [Cytophagales bacterium LB-30]|uniref:Cytochrome c oxidase subunit 3 n=1 Tax=Shiella aurantiaca TaxID=3058365 RepID=A0ABT8F412_9BACT|nr:cytochrome c oxidase subunit 3 [Shiella aurantiaca]MDN4165167.1 cytochrome c oxidase subunit 3 [Shiella aurantiaca]